MKRLILVILCALMIGIPLFAGGGQAASSGSSSADGLTTLKVFGVNKQAAFGGRTVKFSDWVDGTVKSRLWDQFQADLAKRGIKLEFDLIMADQIQTTFQTLLATGRLNDYDFVNAGPGPNEKTRIAMVEQNRFYPINKLVEQYSTGPAREFYTNDIGRVFAKRTTLADGNFYWIEQFNATYFNSPDNYSGASVSGMIRKDWLDAVGLGIPNTLDEFYNALVAFQAKDVNGNGLKDEVANVGMNHFETGIAQWFGLGTTLISSIDNKVFSPWYQPHIQDYFAYMNKLYKAGLLQISDQGNNMAANRIGYMNNWSAETWEEPNIVVQDGAAKAYFVPFVLQAAPDTPFRIHLQEGLQSSRGDVMHFVPAGTKHPEAVAKLLDYLVSMEYYTLSENGIEGYTFNYNSDGTIQRIAPNSSSVGVDNLIIQAINPALWTNASVFPRYDRKNMASENLQAMESGKLFGYPVTGWQLKKDFVDAVYNKKYPLLQELGALLAFPTAQEIDRGEALSSDLWTYSAELITALIIGDKSLSNWNSYIADLKRLGLDERLSIAQAQLDRGR
ncbi:sugar ABC transporter permease [Spirochaetia bacterium]|nr:sugar ABC transporter permease [Spirochaetia bacterium]